MKIIQLLAFCLAFSTSSTGQHYLKVTGGKLKIDNSGTLVLDNTDWVNNTGAELTPGGKVILRGSGTPNSIGGANKNSFNELTVDHTADIQIGSETTIAGVLEFIEGKLILETPDLIIEGMVTGAGVDNYVKTTGSGSIVQTILSDDEYFYPVGNTSYNPVWLTEPSGVLLEFGVRVTDEVLENVTTGTPLSGNAVSRSWHISGSAGEHQNLVLKTQWSATDELPGFSRSSAYLAQGIAGSFDSQSGQSAQGIDPYSITRTGIASDAVYAVLNAANSPPVAICQSITVTLNVNGEYFLNPSEIDNGSYDDEGISYMVTQPDYFSCDNVGNNSVILFVTDVSGITASCTATVTIHDRDEDLDGFSVCEGDCNDDDENVYPGANELCDGLDNNCNGLIDETPVMDFILLSSGDKKSEFGSNNIFNSGFIGANGPGTLIKMGSDNEIQEMIKASKVNIGSNNSIGEVHVPSTGDFSQGNNNNVGSIVDGLIVPLVDIPTGGNPSGSENIIVHSGDTLILSPGSYKNVLVKSNAALLLEPGEYGFKKLDVQSNSAVIAGNNLASSVYVNVDKQVKFGSNNIISINIISRSQKFSLGSGNELTGAFIAEYFDLGSDNTFTLDSYGWCEENGQSLKGSPKIIADEQLQITPSVEVQLTVTPNPSNGYVNIVWNKDNIFKSISIFDQMGRKMGVIPIEENVMQYSGNLSNMISESGVYFLVFHSGNQSITKKLVVLY